MKNILIIITIPFLISGCAFWPFTLFPSWGWLAADAGSLVTTGKSTTDHAISLVADRDCSLFRIIKGERICVQTNDELQVVMYNMDCDTFALNEQDAVYCKGE